MKRRHIWLIILLVFICGWNYPLDSRAEDFRDISDIVLDEGLVRDEAGSSGNEELIRVQDDRPVVSILGDSLGSYQGYTTWSVYYYYYCEKYMDVNDTWWMRYANAHDMRVGVNDSLGGSKVSWVDSDEENYKKSQCMASEERIASLDDNGTPDTILFFGGTNDIGYSQLGTFTPGENIGDVSTFCLAYQTAIARMKESYPDAEIICLTPYYRDVTKMDSNRKEQDDAEVDKYADAIIQICKYYQVKCIDLRKAGLDKAEDMCTPDYLHLNAKGMSKVWYMLEYEKAAPKLLNGMCWLYKDTTIDVGVAYTEDAGKATFCWKVYNLDTKKWQVIADWNESNWVSWTPRKGNYWLNVMIRSEEGVLEEQTICFSVNRNYPVYINGKLLWSSFFVTFVAKKFIGLLLG